MSNTFAKHYEDFYKTIKQMKTSRILPEHFKNVANKICRMSGLVLLIPS